MRCGRVLDGRRLSGDVRLFATAADVHRLAAGDYPLGETCAMLPQVIDLVRDRRFDPDVLSAGPKPRVLSAVENYPSSILVPALKHAIV